MNPFLIAILLFLAVQFFLDMVGRILNLSSLHDELPKDFMGVYSAEGLESPSLIYLTSQYTLITN